MFFDSHAHLHDEKFERDLDRVLDRARAAGITRILTLGDNIEASRRALALAQQVPEVLAAAGVHPHAVSEWSAESERALLELLDAPRVVVVGEIGLDYYHHSTGHDRQREVFRRQLAIARELRMPVSMHCRESYADLLADLKAEKGEEIGGVCHCFSGSLKDAQVLTDMGFSLGVGGSSTYPKAEELRDVLRRIGIHFLLLETDSPYLSPQPKRGRRNEPAHLPITARMLAEFLGESYRDVARITSYNTERAFRLTKDHLAEAVYVTRNQIHVNLTNCCSNSCEFCHRHGEGIVRGHKLLLEEEPPVAPVQEQILKPEYASYRDVVFSGLGEPLMRLDATLQIGRVARTAGKHVILQTNGQGLLLHGPELFTNLKDAVDSVSVSLNAPDQATFNAVCHPSDPERAFGAVLDFIRGCRKHHIPVEATALDLPEVDLAATHTLARELGVELHVHRSEPVFLAQTLR